YRREDGKIMRIQAAAVDSGGHHTEQVYKFTAARFRRRVFAIKGDGGPGKPIWPKRASKSRTNHTLFMVGTNAASDQIYADLRVKAPGAGFCHFSAEYDAPWFAQLLAEKLITKRVNGQNVRAYECPKGVRNEGHDCRRYALAALQSIGARLPAGAPAAAPEADGALPKDGTAQALKERLTEQAAPAPAPKRKKKRRRRGFNTTGEPWL
ncbi:MAG: terminase gpA endonuclease subunit, partial [Oceanicaulis sp.]